MLGPTVSRRGHFGLSRRNAAVPGANVMSVQNWLQAAALAACVIGITPLLGTYLAKVHGGGNAPGDRLFNPVERLFYRAASEPRTRAAMGPSIRVPCFTLASCQWSSCTPCSTYKECCR